MLVNELMSRDIVSVSPDESALFASQLLARHNVGSLPVCSGGKIRGLVTDRDIVLRCVASENDPKATPVKDIMTRNVMTVTPSHTLHDASLLMADRLVRRIPVVENDRLVGMLSLGDLAKNKKEDVEIADTLADISSIVRKK